MAVALGAYGLSPEVFWSMTLPEFRAIERGKRMLLNGSDSEPLSRDEYEDLKLATARRMNG